MKDAPPLRDIPRERLMDAAQRLFCRHGIQGTGIARVIEEAGVSRKTLYQRFRSKDELLHAVLDREGEECSDGGCEDGSHGLSARPAQDTNPRRLGWPETPTPP